MKYLFFITALAVITLDQLTKYLIRISDIPYTINPGSLFGSLQNAPALLLWFSVIVIGVFLYNYDKVQSSDKLCRAGSGLILGGAAGNLADRIIFKGVIDFIDLGWWPSFNIADSAITIGVVLLIIYFAKKD